MKSIYLKFLVRLLGEYQIGTDEDLSLRIESFVIINLHGVSTKDYILIQSILVIYAIVFGL